MWLVLLLFIKCKVFLQDLHKIERHGKLRMSKHFETSALFDN